MFDFLKGNPHNYDMRDMIEDYNIDQESFIEGFSHILKLVVSDDMDIATIKEQLKLESAEIRPKALEGANLCVSFLEGKTDLNKEECLKFMVGCAISEYTAKNTKPLKFLNKLEDIKSVQINDDKSAAISFASGRTIRFSLLSQYLDDFESIEKEYKSGLESARRVGFCYIGSILTSQKLGMKNTVVTGKTHCFGSFTTQHSWVEVMTGRRELVMDCTANLVMDKDSYDYLNTPERISSVSSITIRNDFASGLFCKMTELNIDVSRYLLDRAGIEEVVHPSGGDGR